MADEGKQQIHVVRKSQQSCVSILLRVIVQKAHHFGRTRQLRHSVCGLQSGILILQVHQLVQGTVLAQLLPPDTEDTYGYCKDIGGTSR